MTTDTPNVQRDYEVDESGSRVSTMPLWSPAQVVGLIVGIGFIVLGIAAVARTGFDTGHLDTPHLLVWRFPHSPLLGAIEIAFGVLMVLASVVPGADRAFMAFLGALALAFGLVVLLEAAPNRLNDWLAVTHRSGWLFTVVGAVVLVSALLSPVFGGGRRRRVVRTRPLAE